MKITTTKITNSHRGFIRITAVAALLLTITCGSTAVGPRAAFAHEADCPFCSLPVVQDTTTQDNEVTLKFGRKRIEYRCVYCALAEARTEYKGDLSILAPTEKKGTYVLLKRAGEKWTANLENNGQWQPSEEVVFIGEKVNHRHCQVGYRAFTSRAAFADHAKKHKNVVGDAKPLTLAQMIALAK